MRTPHALERRERAASLLTRALAALMGWRPPCVPESEEQSGRGNARQPRRASGLFGDDDPGWKDPAG